MTIEEMRQSMTQANIYTKTDIDKICELEKQYRDECQEIAEQCEAEGYPSNGSIMNSVVKMQELITMSRLHI